MGSRRSTAWISWSGSKSMTPETALSVVSGKSRWKRRWKVQMIEENNPDWRDLYDEVRLGDLKDASNWVPACAGMSGVKNDG